MVKQVLSPESKLHTPQSLGFRMPAEWEPHEATWIAWPHNLTDWPGKFAPIPWVYGEITRKLAPGEVVRILVNNQQHEARARNVLGRVGVDPGRVEFFRFPTNRGWTRDFGPIFVRRGPPPAVGAMPEFEASTTTPNRDAHGQRAPVQRHIARSEVAIVRFRFNAWAKYPNWQ